ncbi:MULTISPECIES: RRQRL motif-containing zinc-binding protein [Streptomyces]|uniref:RRQRL motif-containing zinc-binding protein n=1 Tax=Streptomyces TaxID=1883 RepID=UPI0003A85DBC|nr:MULTISPECIES: RRQRL motif-containing zinc-binding protein [Streptomyces]
MRTGDQENDALVDIDPYAPTGPQATLPVYKRNQAPDGLATKRQLRAMGLSYGGLDVVAEVETRGPKNGYLYEIAKARPIRPMTLAQEYALDKAMAARQTCPECRRRFYGCLPTSLGICLECHDGTPAHPSSYIPPATTTAA